MRSGCNGVEFACTRDLFARPEFSLRSTINESRLLGKAKDKLQQIRINETIIHAKFDADKIKTRKTTENMLQAFGRVKKSFT